MANFQHLKASRTQILDTFPVKSFGNDGDIVISRVSGRGVFVCIKAGGIWYAANQMQELGRVGKSTVKELTASKLTIQNIVNTQTNIDNYAVSDLGNIKYKTGKQVVNDLPLPFKNISYKSAYCSLEQYSDKETCEVNGGTWYYSENNSHDSISSTAENQLLTIGQMHNSVDTEPTLLYDGSVLEIKRNTNFDDNWQTATVNSVLKLSYSPTVSSQLGTDSNGNLRITASNTVLSGTLEISTIAEVGSDTDKFLMSDSGVVKFVTGANLRSYIGAGTGDGDITGVSITTDTGAGSKAEDTGGSADFSILGSSGVGVTNSGTTITAVAVPAEIDHDSLSNFVANEHVDHTSITLTAGDGLTGGGDISSNRSFAVSVDDSTIEISSDSLRVKDDGITYAKLQNVTDARMLGNNAGSDGVVTEMTKANVLSFLNVSDGANANVSGDSGNAAIYDNSGTPAFKSGITKAEVLSLLNVADGAGVAPTNFVTNDADDTMAGTLTIDKNNTATTTANVRGLAVDFDHTGISASGQTINNIVLDLSVRSDAVTHVGTVNNYGIVNTLTAGTSGTQTNYGIYNTITGADTNVGIFQKVTNGHTDLKFVSHADEGDYFSIATTAHGATTITTVDDDATAANLLFDIDGDITLDAHGKNVYMAYNGTSLFDFDLNSSSFKLMDSTDTGDYFQIDVNTHGATTIATVDDDASAADLTLDVDGDITLDAHGKQIYFSRGGTNSFLFDMNSELFRMISGLNSNDYFQIAIGSEGATTISTVDADTTAGNLTLDIDGDIALDSASGNFIAKKAGTEFSVANSAYAGMVLGYRMIGEDATHASYTLTTSYAVPNSAMTVRFVAPPSGAVEIMIQIYANASTSNRFLYFGLSDNATYNTIGATYEQLHRMPDETDDSVVQHYWTVTGLTAGDTYNYWLGAKTSGTTAYLGWGGTLSGRFSDFIMKATALPAATSDFAEYD